MSMKNYEILSEEVRAFPCLQQKRKGLQEGRHEAARLGSNRA